MNDVKNFRVDTKSQSLVIISKSKSIPEIIYWGKNLSQDEDLYELYKNSQKDLTGGMLDILPPISILIPPNNSFPGQPSIEFDNLQADGFKLKFKLDKAEQKMKDKNEVVLSLFLYDEVFKLTYIANFITYYDTDIIAINSEVITDKAIKINYLSCPVMPINNYTEEFISYSGRWCQEFQKNTIPWNRGAYVRENRLGRTAHEHFPSILIPSKGSSENNGSVYGFHYGFSGGHKMVAEELQDGRRYVQFGDICDDLSKPTNHHKSHNLYLSYSAFGFNGLAINYQDFVRSHIVKFSEKQSFRPVHYNCWEAVYFKHNLDELKEIATLANKLGAERFVLDDGWFKGRDDDTTSLGDWVVDSKKYPNGLHPLIEHVKSLNMSFGIWLEPEMVNFESDFYKQNSDCIISDKEQILGRNQLVLDLSNEAVWQSIFKSISALLDEYDISYIKWDHNRVLPYPDNRQAKALYKLLEKLRALYPNCEIESCASGGGRIDYEILKYTQRVWLSDSNDALERAEMQHNASQFLPFEIIGSHIGPRKCHTSGRVHSIEFRTWVAASRHLGYEFDPRELDENEIKIVEKITQWWKRNRLFLQKANILNLETGDRSLIAEMHISKTCDKFFILVFKLFTSKHTLPRPIYLSGLNDDDIYSLKLINSSELSSLSRGEMAIKSEGIKLSGRVLTHQGLNIPLMEPASALVFEGNSIN